MYNRKKILMLFKFFSGFIEKRGKRNKIFLSMVEMSGHSGSVWEKVNSLDGRGQWTACDFVLIIVEFK